MKKLSDKQMMWGGAAILATLAIVLFWKDIKGLFTKAKYNMTKPSAEGLDKAKLLGIGDKGPEVAYLQSLLKEDGADLGRYGIDGDFGPVTLAALQAVKGVDEISINEYTGQPVREQRQNYRT